MTITLHWWYLPVGLFVLAILLFLKAVVSPTSKGMFSGAEEMLASGCFAVAGIASLITGLLR